MKLKLSEVVAKYGNVAIDEAKFKEVLGVKESKVWKPSLEEKYWYVSMSGNVNCETNEEYQADIGAYQLGNAFKTKEEAEFVRDKQIFLTKFERYLREHEDEPVDWRNLRQTKYFVQFNHHRKSIETNFWDVHEVQGAIHTTSRKAIEQFIKDNEADIKKYLFGLK